jgi:putative membrane protein
MNILTNIFIVLVAIEFGYIFYIETIATTSKKTSETFGINQDALEGRNVNVLLKNQGVYNLLIAAMLLIALFIIRSEATVAMLLGYILLVAAYGAISSDPMIFPKQGGLALMALILLLVFGI